MVLNKTNSDYKDTSITTEIQHSFLSRQTALESPPYSRKQTQKDARERDHSGNDEYDDGIHVVLPDNGMHNCLAHQGGGKPHPS